MNSRLINLSALFFVGTVARLADAQGVNLAPANATDPLRAPPPDAATSATGPATANDNTVTVDEKKSAGGAPAQGSVAASTTTAQTTNAPGATAAPSESGDEGPLAMGLAPFIPPASKLPSGATPNYEHSKRIDDWHFDFHGYLNLPLVVGLHNRKNAYEGQQKLSLHTPPRIPGDLESFDYTGLMPTPYAQLNFSYGNSFVAATVIIAARSVTDATAYFNPPDQMGINNAYLTFKLLNKSNDKIYLDVGAFANRYGIMGEYDLGRYGTPLIAKMGGMGTTATGRFTRGDLRFMGEAGIMGQLNKAPVGEEPGSWNGYSDPNTGTSFILHGHGSVDYKRRASLALHGIYTFVQDDRVAPSQKDGHISILGAETRFSVGRFGHLYLGYANTSAIDARGVSSVIRVLNTKGGPGLMSEYLGPNSGGTGSLNTLGFEYDISLGNLLRSPGHFNGRAPDVSLGAFGIFTAISSNDKAYDSKKKFKYGLEGAYSMASWFAVGGRYDRVLADMDDMTRTHSIATARLIFRSDWQSNDQVMLSYSRLFNGSSVWVKEGNPPVYSPTIVPDADVVSLIATMWW